jgi:hypothetical protein
MRRPASAAAALLAALAAAAPLGANLPDEAPASPASATAVAGPLVEQMVVYRSGRAAVRRVRAATARVRASGRSCAVRAGTPLAALARSRVSRLRLRDFGSCSRLARDGGGLFVSGIGPDLNRGRSGWVYKVGPRLGTAGAGDPRGPFGRGLLRSRARVLWFYCQAPPGSSDCQRTLAVSSRAEGAGVVAVRAVAYDDRGAAVPAAGARVFVGAAASVTGPDGVARVTVAPGVHPVRAEQAGLVRSFVERVVVR